MKPDLCCVVWLNPSRVDHPQSRLLQALTSNGTPPKPLSIPRKELQAFKNATYIYSEDDFQKRLNSSSPESPIIISTELATEILGWEDFQFTHYIR